MAPERKSNIKPLCDKHLVEMEATRAIRKMGGADVWDYSVFRCSALGCDRLLDRGEYVTRVSDGSIDPDCKNFISCEDGHLMFIESVEEDRLVWRCCIVGCERSRTTDRDFRPSDENTVNLYRIDGTFA
jgi:hypothetical protein